MCYINEVRVSYKEYIAYKQKQKALAHLSESLLNQPATSGFVHAAWPVIKPTPDGKDWDIVPMEWGFIPSYLQNREAVKKFRTGYTDETGRYHTPVTTLNFVGEEVMDKPMFKDAALQRRCLVLSSGFWEHRHISVMGKKGKLLKTPEKFPYYISVINQPYFFMAGIWNNWTDKDSGETVDSFAIGTTAANNLMQQIHNTKNRMPVILPPHLAAEWTEPYISPERIKAIASYQINAKELEAHLVPKNFMQLQNQTVETFDERVPALLYE